MLNRNTFRFGRQYYKMIIRYLRGPGPEAVNQGPEQPGLPMFFDLSSDPHEDYNLWNTTLTMGWVYAPMQEIMGACERECAGIPEHQARRGLQRLSKALSEGAGDAALTLPDWPERVTETAGPALR